MRNKQLDINVLLLAHILLVPDITFYSMTRVETSQVMSSMRIKPK